MSFPPSSVLHAIVTSAVDATGAANGWIVADVDGALVVVAAAGGDHPQDLVGSRLRADAQAAFTVGSGQPVARRPSPSDAAALGAAGYDGLPASLLSVPCTDGRDGTVGALELAGKRGGAFTVDDVELATLLADVAGAAIADARDAAPPPSPDELAAGLRRLSEGDPIRYATVAAAVRALLGAG